MANKEPMRGKVKAPAEQAPEYLATKTGQIDGRQVNAGATVRYAGLPGKYLRPIDGAGAAVMAKMDKIRKGEGLDKALSGEDRVRAIQQALRDYSDELLGVTSDDPSELNARDRKAAMIDTPLPDAERKPLLAAAEQTRKDTLEQSSEAGGVLLQLQGTQPSTVIPSTGPMAEASEQEKASTAEKLKGK